MTIGLVVALALLGTPAQDEKALPAFPSRAEAVTLDVVVVDKQGRPVRGLAASDFTVFEEGLPQLVVAFEAVDLGIGPPEPAPAAGDRLAPTPTDLPGAGAHPQSPRSERAFAFIIDDLGLDFSPMIGVKKAITHWLETQASPGDDVTIVTTSGDLSWNDRVATGREDLLGILGRVTAAGRPRSQFFLSLGEAHLINDTTAGDRRMAGRGESDDGVTIGSPGGLIGPQTLLARLVKRAADAGACFHPQECESIVRIAAREVYDQAARSSRLILGSVARLSPLMGPRRGRKSIVVFSESFVRGTIRAEEEAALRASQAANTAVYLVDAKGLTADPYFRADIQGAPTTIDLGTQTLDGGLPDAAYLADATGGRIMRNNNDLTSGLGRILDESSAYYRIGYQPEKAPDGRWRKLKVEVRRRKVEVRARRGYFASPVLVAKAPAPSPRSVPPKTQQPAPLPAQETPTPPNSPAPVAGPDGVATPDPVLALVLERAGEYVVDYGETFRDVVAEEDYVQWDRVSRRRTRSDLVFVSMPGPIPWTCFRDVFEVDGRQVRERESRLEKLFLAEPQASAVKKADAIVRASAQYNLGATRTINVPTLPLLFLHPENQARFRFERKGRRRFGTREAVEILFAEVVRPTLVNDGDGRDVPAAGRVFVDARDGLVLQTEVTLHPTYTLAHLKTEYRLDPGLKMWLPAEMSEQYRDPQGRTIDTEATALYSKYRRFGVTTDEQVDLPTQ